MVNSDRRGHRQWRHRHHNCNGDTSTGVGVAGGMQLMPPPPPPNNGTPGAGTPVGAVEEYNSKGLMFQ